MIRRPMRFFKTAAVTLCLLVASCSLTGQWRSRHQMTHPLVGVCWSVAAGEKVGCEEVRAAVRRARLLLLGEQHDNPDHHRLQAELLREAVAIGRRPALVLEMVEPGVGEKALAACRSAPGHGCTTRVLRRELDWDSGGWPDWQLYRPVFRVAIERDLVLAGAGVRRGEARALVGEVERLLDARSAAELRTEIIESHCGYAPEHAVDAMVLVQQARDARMADTLAAWAGRDSALRDGTVSDGAVLLAGLGHTRLDRGVAWHLDDAERAGLVAVALVEVSAGLDRAPDYATNFDGRLPFDFLWFTPRTDDRDPCERFKEQLRLMGGKP